MDHPFVVARLTQRPQMQVGVMGDFQAPAPGWGAPWPRRQRAVWSRSCRAWRGEPRRAVPAHVDTPAAPVILAPISASCTLPRWGSG